MSTLKHTSPLNLTTLNTKPTWHNRAGRIDRSACFVLTAAKHWRHIHPDRWTYRYPARQALRQAQGKCDRYAALTFFARDLWMLHKWQQPYPLQGDFRSAKANALRTTPRPSGKRTDNTKPSAHDMRNDPVLGTGPINPNRGVGFKHHKMLGLSCLWQATLRIERYVQHAKLKQHFFVCPVCGPRNDNPNPQHPKPNPPARLAGRCTKLYLPLCTEREYEDAQLAQLWLKTNINPNRPLSPIAVRLIERYGELFEGPSDSGGRRLRCRQCLGLRYGEVKAQLPTRAFRKQSSISKHQLSIKTEQALFLSNLPKLLKKPGERPRGKPRRFMASRTEPGNFMLKQSTLPAVQAVTRIDDLPASAREALLRLFTGSLPAFKTLETMKRQMGEG